MANESGRLSDQATWTLAGIQTERAALQRRLDYLLIEERKVQSGSAQSAGQQRSTTNGSAKPKAKAVTQKGRRRGPSAATRAKMREAAKKRWAERNKQSAAPVATSRKMTGKGSQKKTTAASSVDAEATTDTTDIPPRIDLPGTTLQ